MLKGSKNMHQLWQKQELSHYFWVKLQSNLRCFLKNLHDWQEFYTTAGHTGRAKYQLWMEAPLWLRLIYALAHCLCVNVVCSNVMCKCLHECVIVSSAMPFGIHLSHKQQRHHLVDIQCWDVNDHTALSHQWFFPECNCLTAQ